MRYDITPDQRRELEQVILARLEAKSSHEYQWPRWPAAYEASEAVSPIVARMIADAEQRGYNRGRIEALNDAADECDEIQRIGQTKSRDVTDEEMKTWFSSPLSHQFGSDMRPRISGWLRDLASPVKLEALND